MDKKSAIETLKILGLTEYEAKTYIALNHIGKGKAKDIHQYSSIPRSAVYGILTKLEEKGLINVEYGKPMLYKSIEPEMAIKHLIRNINSSSDNLIEFLKEDEAKLGLGQPSESVWALRSFKNLIFKLSEMISLAQEEIILVAYNPLFSDSGEPFPIINSLMPLIQQKINENIRLRVICMEEDQIPLLKHYFPSIVVKLPDKNMPSSKIQLKGDVLMVDNREVLINVVGAEVVSPEDLIEISAVYIRAKNLVSVFRHLIEVSWDYAMD